MTQIRINRRIDNNSNKRSLVIYNSSTLEVTILNILSGEIHYFTSTWLYAPGFSMSGNLQKQKLIFIDLSYCQLHSFTVYKQM